MVDHSLERGQAFLDAAGSPTRGAKGAVVTLPYPAHENAPESIFGRIEPINWLDLANRTPPDREWHIEHWLTPGPTIFVGLGGMGKTQIAQQLGTCLSTGRDFIDRVPRPLKVLMWACEDTADELWRRQTAINTHYGVEMGALDGGLIVVPRVGQDNTLYTVEFGRPAFTGVMGVLEEQLNDYKADVLLIDNIGQTYGANENDRHQVTTFVNGLVGACHGRPVSIVLMGHPSRGQGSEYAGSAAWENAVRMRWFLGDRLPNAKDQPDEDIDDAVRYLCKRKANYSSKDYRQFAYQDGVYALQSSPDTGNAGPYRKALAEKVFVAALRTLAERNINTSDRTSARNFAPTVIHQYGLNQAMTKAELATAMRSLILGGTISRAQVGFYANRTPQEGLVISQ